MLASAPSIMPVIYLDILAAISIRGILILDAAPRRKRYSLNPQLASTVMTEDKEIINE